MKKINQVLYQAGKTEEYPMIKIANNYLKDAGFNYGDKIEIDYQKELIIIKKVVK